MHYGELASPSEECEPVSAVAAYCYIAHLAKDLVANTERVDRVTPLAASGMDVAVADSRIRDRDVHVVRTNRAAVDRGAHHLTSRILAGQACRSDHLRRHRGKGLTSGEGGGDTGGGEGGTTG